MNKIIKIIKLCLIILSLSCIVVLIFPKETYKEFGEYAWFLLIGVMLVRPLKDIFPQCKIFSFLAKLRREFGILVGVFGIAHGIGAFIDQMMLINYTKTYIELFFDPYVWKYTGYMFWGILAGAVSIPLLMTSNGLSVSLLGKHWKTLQRLSYIMFVFVGLHIYFIKKEIGPLIIVSIWIIFFIIAFIKNKRKKQNLSAGPKWLCVPCGYIYDENLGDPDSGIAPGTRFEDIPEDWRCPVCGVGKSDFILLQGEIQIQTAKVSSLNYLTPDVIELQIDLGYDFSYTPGQFLTFVFTDNTGSFNRSYSIANRDNTTLTFFIKIKKDGRAGQIFPTLKVGDSMNYTDVGGKFQLLFTQNPKVFIATGTGLSAIYAMILQIPEVNKKLYFGVATQKDLFYLEQLKSQKNLELQIHLSREEIEGYHFGRIDFTHETFATNTEFYLCGNPGVIQSTKKILSQKGFTQVFSEEF